MGKVYAVLSDVENPAENCRKAINAFEEVLRVCPLEDFPFDYAETQNDLGKVYTKLSKVEDTTENSRKAIIAYKEALKVFKKEKYPERYHSIKENLFEAIS